MLVITRCRDSSRAVGRLGGCGVSTTDGKRDAWWSLLVLLLRGGGTSAILEPSPTPSSLSHLRVVARDVPG